MGKIRVALVADIHHGPDFETKRGSDALRLLNRFTETVNRTGVDLTVDLGDRITSVDAATDYRNEREVADAFSALKTPLRHIVGNHDVACLSVPDNERALSTSLGSSSLDLGGFHLVFWNASACVPFSDFAQGPLYSDVEWLRADLENSSLPSIVFTHFPLETDNPQGEFYFGNYREFIGIPGPRSIGRTLAQWGHVVLCISGHVHHNSWHCVDDIPFVSLQSLTESSCTAGRSSEVWGTLELGQEIIVEIRGLQPMSLTLPLRQKKARWSVRDPKQRILAWQERARERYLRSSVLPIRGIALDLDGVVWRGSELIPGSDDFIHGMRRAGIPISIVTNNAGRTREEYVKKLAGFGIPFAKEDIFTAGYGTARWIARISPRSRVRIVGKEAIHKEFRDAGFEESDTPDYLVVSMDEGLTVGELSDALQWLENGVRLVITNPDVTLPTSTGVRAECGAVRAFLETCCKTRGIVIGKPERFLFEMALEHMRTGIEHTVMIGDTPETDIEGALRMGMRAIRVETGSMNAEGPQVFPWKTLRRLADAEEFILDHNRNAVLYDNTPETNRKIAGDAVHRNRQSMVEAILLGERSILR